MSWAACQDLLISLGIRSTVLALVIAVTLRVMRGQSAQVRCAALSMGMLGLALLPLSLCLPRVELSWLPSLGVETPAVASVAPAQAALSWWSPWVLLWFVGIGAIACWQSLGLWRLDAWRRRSRALESGYWQAMLTEVCETLEYGGRPRLYVMPRLGSPAAAGVWRPCVFLPEDAVQWDAERLRVVLLHEVGHLKRRDLWTQWLSQLVCTLYWFHPLVWWLNRTLHQEREFACDATVLSSGTEPSTYARHLVALAENLRLQPRPALTHGLFLAMASPQAPGALERRVTSILSFRGSRRLPMLVAGVLLALGAGVVWATATLSPVTKEGPVRWPNLPVPKEPVSWTDQEVRQRLLAEAFPGA